MSARPPEWLRVEEVADLLGVSRSTVKRQVRKGMCEARQVPKPHGGQPMLEIALSSLPEQVQARLAARSLAAVRETLQAEAPLALSALAPPPVDRTEASLAGAPAWKRDVALARKRLVEDTLYIEGSEGKTLAGEALRQALDAWCAAHPGLPHVTAKACGTPRAVSSATAYHWRQKLREHGPAGLLPGWGRARGASGVPTPLFRAFCAVYLQQGQPSAEEARRQALAWARARQQEPAHAPSAKSFLRRLHLDVEPRAVFLARHGEDAFRNEFGQYVLRDAASLQPGEVLVSDHRRLDVTVVCPETGRLVRPWLTAWVCMRTHRRIAWSLHTSAPSAADVLLTFKWACEVLGFIPDVVYLDNGRDYTALDFGGDQHSQAIKGFRGRGRAQGLLSALGVTALFARPKNARAKVIEPLFKATITRLEKHLVGYTGKNAASKPEKLKGEVASGRLMTFAALDALVSRVHAALNREPSHGRTLKGESPDEAWARLLPLSGTRRTLSPEAAALLLVRTARPVLVARNGATVTVPGTKTRATFWGEWMAPLKGTRVVVRTDPRRPGHAWVFGEDDAFLGEARTDQHTASALARTPGERAHLTRLLEAQAAEMKAVRAEAAHARRLPDEEPAPRGLRPGEEGMHLVVGSLRAGGEASPSVPALNGGAPYAGGHAAPLGEASGAPIQTPFDGLEAEAARRRAAHTGPLYAPPPPPKKPALKVWAHEFDYDPNAPDGIPDADAEAA